MSISLTNDKQLTISIGNSRKATSWSPLTLTVSELYTRLEMPLRGTETMAEYLALSKAEQDNIANVFREINNTLTSMGGLNIPVIATGTAVPYSARISPVARGGSFNMSDLPGCIDDSERIYTMVSLLRQILERLERNGRINNDDLAAAIAFALRGESRGFGAV